MSTKVTDTIKQDLTHQIQTFSELPFRLTLGAIADYYAVSLTPVRQVVEQLIEENIICRKPNGRLERTVTPKGGGKSSKVTEFKKPLKLSSNLDEKVANDVIKLCFENHTDYLREEATAKKYETGRTIIRQVFSRLAGTGLIEHVPRCGWKVRSFREKDMLDYLEIREILEVKALQLARPFLVQDDLQNMLSGNVVSAEEEDSEIDNNLHDYWITRCDNFYIQDFFKRHGDFYTALFDYASVGASVKSEMAQEHRDILENLIAKNWRQAESALVKHIRDQKENVLRLIQLKKSG
ncbi:GntR family transcriptional regulator [Aliikangiella sp. IMCC44359]|uniref:GntR family transcriptional regulator n=1 Tax=Aliikangiella sp. IMCC44359 TaxID=3459125 RepID=UPI00403B1CF6